MDARVKMLSTKSQLLQPVRCFFVSDVLRACNGIVTSHAVRGMASKGETGVTPLSPSAAPQNKRPTILVYPTGKFWRHVREIQ